MPILWRLLRGIPAAADVQKRAGQHSRSLGAGRGRGALPNLLLACTGFIARVYVPLWSIAALVMANPVWASLPNRMFLVAAVDWIVTAFLVWHIWRLRPWALVAWWFLLLASAVASIGIYGSLWAGGLNLVVLVLVTMQLNDMKASHAFKWNWRLAAAVCCGSILVLLACAVLFRLLLSEPATRAPQPARVPSQLRSAP